MSSAERIYVPNRPSDPPEQLVSGGAESDILSLYPIGLDESTETWCFSDSFSEIYTETPRLLSSWLLKSTHPETIGVLGSPFAKLELTKEGENISLDNDELTNIYGFRLVSLNIVAIPKTEPVELEIFKLIAGNYAFHRHDDEAARLELAIALVGFRLGELRLDEYDRWENHFSDKNV